MNTLNLNGFFKGMGEVPPQGTNQSSNVKQKIEDLKSAINEWVAEQYKDDPKTDSTVGVTSLKFNKEAGILTIQTQEDLNHINIEDNKDDLASKIGEKLGGKFQTKNGNGYMLTGFTNVIGGNKEQPMGTITIDFRSFLEKLQPKEKQIPIPQQPEQPNSTIQN